MKVVNQSFDLNNGVSIPKIGFGTWQIPDGKICYNAVTDALKIGYRHIDTAMVYNNESSVGKAVRESKVNREEIFVTSKLPAFYKTYDEAAAAFDKTMNTIGLDYLDLYLIHAPWASWDDRDRDLSKENIEVWRAMEDIYKSGRCRSIGVSNFRVSDLNAVLENCRVRPMVNQIRFFIGNSQPQLTEFCQKNDILVEGYSPFATGRILENKEILAMADRYGKSLPQICMRYALQKNVLPLPKSVHYDYILQNIDVDFTISHGDMDYLDGLAT